MKVFVAGASGAIGRRLVPLLIARGHQVTGTTSRPENAERIRAIGADPVVMNGLDRAAVTQAVAASAPEVVVHQMTALASMRSLKKFDAEFELTNRLRTEGTEHLLAAAKAVGARKLIAQSYTGWPNERQGSRIKTEHDPLDAHPPAAMARSLAAIRSLERVAEEQALAGVVLRYGSLYGPGTLISATGEIVRLVRARQMPIVGEGVGVWSFIHADDAAQATLRAVEIAPPGIYNIVDDEPAEVREWLPYLARVLAAKPPRRVPAWIARLLLGDAGVSMMTAIKGSSNAKAKRTLDWQPAYATWRDGFRRALDG